MMRILTIARLNLLELVRDKGELVGATLLPLLLTWVFSTAFGSAGVERPISIPIADADQSQYSRFLAEIIDEPSAFMVDPVSESEARALVTEGETPVALIIPSGMGRDLEAGKVARIELLRYPGSANGIAAATVIEGAVTRISADMRAARAAREISGTDSALSLADLFGIAERHWEPEPPVGVSSTTAEASGERGDTSAVASNVQYSLGFTIFFVFMTAMGSASGVLEEREIGTLRRLLAAPMRRFEVLTGKLLGVAAVAAAQAALLVGVGAFIFGVDWGSDPAAVALLLLSLVFSATGLGVMISALVRTRGQMSALVPIVSTGMAMVGGCYWDLSVTSPFMQRLAQFTPTGWAMSGLTDIVARGMGLEAALLPAAVLMAFSAVSIGVGVTRLRLE